MCQGCETERRRKTVSRILPVQISMWSQHLITVIPSEVEADAAPKALGQARPPIPWHNSKATCRDVSTSLDMTNYS